MNININKCENGWIVTKYNNNNLYTSVTSSSIAGSLTTYPMPTQEQFVFTNFEEFFQWFRINFVLDKLK